MQQIDVGEPQAISIHAAGPIDEAHDRQHGDAFAGAGLADDAEDRAGVERQVEAVDGAEYAMGGGEFDHQVADFEERRHRFSLGSSASRRPSPNRLNASTVSRIAKPGNASTHQAR